MKKIGGDLRVCCNLAEWVSKKKNNLNNLNFAFSILSEPEFRKFGKIFGLLISIFYLQLHIHGEKNSFQARVKWTFFFFLSRFLRLFARVVLIFLSFFVSPVLIF